MSQVVVVTGCSEGGIGFALCQEFLRQGCKVYATARNLEALESLMHPNVEKLKLDVTSDVEVHEVIQHILRVEGRVDIAVNNAGSIAAGPLIDQSIEHVKQILDTNTLSVLRVAKTVIPSMASRKSGLIVNIGSIVGEIPTPWNGLYSASKSALQTISEVLSMECRPFNISVMHVSPGAVQSNLSKNQSNRFSLSKDSLYTPYLPNIIARIHTSQASNRMPTDVFAKKVVSKALSRSPPTYMTLGGNSFLFTVFKWFPRSWVLLLMWWVHSRKRTGA